MSADEEIGKAFVALAGCGLVALVIVIFVIATLVKVWLL